MLALFFCHLFALGLYGLELLAFETHRLWTRRGAALGTALLDFVATGVPFLLALLLLVTGPTWDSAGVPAYWDLAGKIDGLMLVVGIYYPWIAYVLIAILALAAVLAGRWRGMLHVHPVGWALLGVGAVVYLALPRVLFAAHLADQRLPIALAFMLVACIRVDLRRPPPAARPCRPRRGPAGAAPRRGRRSYGTTCRAARSRPAIGASRSSAARACSWSTATARRPG